MFQWASLLSGVCLELGLRYDRGEAEMWGDARFGCSAVLELVRGSNVTKWKKRDRHGRHVVSHLSGLV